MNKFLPTKDELSKILQEKATNLYQKLKNLPVDELGLPDYCLAYFKMSHFARLFFSIQTSAHLLYRSILLINSPISKLVIMDYGAGVGTLYMLAKMIGVKQVIYNDHLEDWKKSALLICKAIGVTIDEYIVGEIDETLDILNKKKIRCHIITSRNVVEHIYKLDHFYKAISLSQPQALIYSSTTANFYNPASNIKHFLLHKKSEKIYFEKRKEIIRQLTETDMAKNEQQNIERLAEATRGLSEIEILQAVKQYQATNLLPDNRIQRSNTCNPTNGVWAEHLLTFEEYRELIGTDRYKITFEPGFWDTHYKNPLKNFSSKMLNKGITLAGKAGIFLAPFIYIIAEPLNRYRKN